VELDGPFQALLHKRQVRLALSLFALLLLAGYLLIPPSAPLKKAHLLGYSICHQIPERSFFLGGRHLPLCARCTGTYLGIAIGFATAALLGRARASQMPSRGMLIALILSIGVMGVDGLNSYLGLVGFTPPLYTPQNWLRAATGTLNGIALSMIVLPVFNQTLWEHPRPERALRNGWELLGMAATGGLAIALLQTEPSWLLYPMALLSAGGVLWMLTLINGMILLIIFRLDAQAQTWRDAAFPLLMGLIATLVELTTIGVLRYALTGTLSWPTAL
jgi:uncharacterized membrane protein